MSLYSSFSSFKGSQWWRNPAVMWTLRREKKNFFPIFFLRREECLRAPARVTRTIKYKAVGQVIVDWAGCSTRSTLAHSQRRQREAVGRSMTDAANRRACVKDSPRCERTRTHRLPSQSYRILWNKSGGRSRWSRGSDLTRGGERHVGTPGAVRGPSSQWSQRKSEISQ